MALLALAAAVAFRTGNSPPAIAFMASDVIRLTLPVLFDLALAMAGATVHLAASIAFLAVARTMAFRARDSLTTIAGRAVLMPVAVWACDFAFALALLAHLPGFALGAVLFGVAFKRLDGPHQDSIGMALGKGGGVADLAVFDLLDLRVARLDLGSSVVVPFRGVFGIVLFFLFVRFFVLFGSAGQPVLRRSRRAWIFVRSTRGGLPSFVGRCPSRRLRHRLPALFGCRFVVFVHG